MPIHTRAIGAFCNHLSSTAHCVHAIINHRLIDVSAAAAVVRYERLRIARVSVSRTFHTMVVRNCIRG